MQREEHSGADLTRRGALALAGAAGAAAIGAGSASADPAAAGPARGGSAVRGRAARSLDSMFEEASAKYRVPRDVLAAVGYNESRFDNHGGEPSMSNGFGIMHLADNPTNRTLAEAGRLTGFSADRLCTDDAANILGAAAVLASRADRLGVARDADGDVTAWHPVIAAYPALADGTTSRLYAQGAYLALRDGVTEQGVVIAAQAVPPQLSQTARIAAQSEVRTAPVPVLQAGGASIASSASSSPAPSVIWSPAYSGNYRKANRPTEHPIKYVVVHTVQGSYASAISWFKSAAARVSAHYVIRSRDGQIAQCVADKDIAWHAGNSEYNRTSIGIEHEGYVSSASWYTEAMYRSSAALTASICDKYGIPKTRDRIIAHIDVPRATHTDPGRHWDWGRYLGYVQAAEPLAQGTPAHTPWTEVIDTVTAGPDWWVGASNPARYGAGYRYTRPKPVTDTAWFLADLPARGQYKVEVWYPSGSTYNPATPFVMATTSGNQFVQVDQRRGGKQWKTLGTYTFDQGRRQVVGVSRWSRSPGWVVADAVRLTRVA